MDYLDQLYTSYYPEMTPVLLAIGGVLFLFAYFVLLGIFRTMRMPRVHLRAFAFSTAVVYYYMVLLSTVFTRPEHADRQYNLELFWSYKRAFAGDYGLAKEIVLNIVMFVPMGFLITCVVDFLVVYFNRRVFGRVVFRLSLLIGVVCSAAIEVLQLLLCRGLFEWDDIFDNTIGFLVGTGIFMIISRNRYRKRKY